MDELLLMGLPLETWGMIVIIWIIVLLNVLFMRKKIKKTELEEMKTKEIRDGR